MHSPSPLLLPRHYSKLSRGIIGISSRTGSAALLRNFAPPAIWRFRLARAAANDERPAVRIREATFVGKFPTLDKLIGEAATIERLGARVDGVGDDVGIWRKREQGGDEVIDWSIISERVQSCESNTHTGYVRVQAFPKRSPGPLLKLFICPLEAAPAASSCGRRLRSGDRWSSRGD